MKICIDSNRFASKRWQQCTSPIVAALLLTMVGLGWSPTIGVAQVVESVQSQNGRSITPLTDRRYSYFIQDPDAERDTAEQSGLDRQFESKAESASQRQTESDRRSPAAQQTPQQLSPTNNDSVDSLPSTIQGPHVASPSDDGVVDVVESKVLVLEDFVEYALQNHPTLAAAAARINAVGAEAVQSSLPNNPRVGVYGEEIFNNENALLGAFWSKTHINPLKLALRSNVQLSQAEVLRLRFEAQRLRILTDTRSAFYRVLIGQKQMELAQSLLDLQARAVDNAQVLFDAQETSKTELLQTKIQARQTEFKLQQSRSSLSAAWRELAAVVGAPQLPMARVQGSVDAIGADLEWDAVLSELLASSPEIAAAKADVGRAKSVVLRELGENQIDVNTQFTVGHDTSTDDFFGGFQVGVPLRTTNVNQGNIAAAKARYHAAVLEVQRVELNVQKRLATVFRDYETALHQTNVYTDQLLPNARESLELVSQAYREGEISFLQLLSSQQTLTNVTTDYLNSLGQLWSSRQKIEGLLLSDSLEQ